MLSTCIDMCLSLCLRCIEACALQNNIYTKLAPRKLSCVSLCIDGDLLAVNSDVILTGLNLVAKSISALCGIILQKVCQHLRRCQVVDCNDLKSLCTKHLSESKTADTAKTIDCYFYCHSKNPPAYSKLNSFNFISSSKLHSIPTIVFLQVQKRDFVKNFTSSLRFFYYAMLLT